MRDENREKFDLMMGETGISLSLTSIMTTVSFLFIILILQSGNRNLSELRIPLMYLFISSFSFLYSTLIYANVSGNIARLKKEAAEKQLCVGNVISEFYGVYFIVFMMPMVFFAYIKDSYFTYVILFMGIAGFWFYHQFGYSILDRYVKSAFKFFLLVIIVSIIHAINVISFINFNDIYLYLSTAILIISITIITIYSVCIEEGIHNIHK